MTPGDWQAAAVCLAVLLWASLVIDPRWKDARKDLPFLDRVVRRLSWFGGPVERALTALWYLEIVAGVVAVITTILSLLP